METVNTAYASSVSVEGALEILREYPSMVGQAVLSVGLLLAAGYSLKKIMRTVRNDRLTQNALQALKQLSSKLHPDLIPLLSDKDKEECQHPRHGVRLERSVVLPWTVARAITRLSQEEQLVFVREHVTVQGRASCIKLIAFLEERSPSKKKPQKVSRACPGTPPVSLREVSSAKPFTSEERSELDALCRQYRGKIRKEAQFFVARLPANIEINDLIQVGMIALCEAWRRFDPLRREEEFWLFVRKRIVGAFLDYLRVADHLSRSERRQVKKLGSAINGFEHIDRGALARELGIKLDALEELLCLRHVRTISDSAAYFPGEPVDHDQETWSERIPARSGDPVLTLQLQERVARIEQSTSECFPDDNERGALVLGVVLGEISSQEAARLLDLTPSRVSQLTERLKQFILAD